jgi:hypothetical protein
MGLQGSVMFDKYKKTNFCLAGPPEAGYFKFVIQQNFSNHAGERANGENLLRKEKQSKRELRNEFKTEKCIAGCRFVSFGAGGGGLSG